MRHSGWHPEQLARHVEGLAVGRSPALTTIPNPGTQVWPPTGVKADLVDDYRCRFVPRDATQPLEGSEVLARLQAVGLDHRWVHVEKLQDFDGVQDITAAQGQC